MNDMEITRVHIPEVEVPGKRLGRHVHHDPRSRDYRANTAPSVISAAHTTHGLPLDQARGSCTAEALCGALDSDPNFAGHELAQTDADHLYDEEIVAEGGDPATDDPGGTGLLICQVAQKDGLISSYTHAFSLDEALRALVVCPVIAGVNWYEGFDHPDDKGLVAVAGQVRGGHEICALQILADEKLVGFAQSWGDWGVANAAIGLTTGAFFMSFDTLDRLLGEQGDVTVPVVAKPSG